MKFPTHQDFHKPSVKSIQTLAVNSKKILRILLQPPVWHNMTEAQQKEVRDAYDRTFRKVEQIRKAQI